ncbi:TMV resistance protein N-like [Pyrus ussuriensis x Pyrus communis]|uniref:ADP-ribosyl cyclase/cyclic ADP-ribose hydrolase n=1 Tax=Pyrus ussuriensis x Pyrus communis TaxID=2448454 RepID=A0A5N5ICY8_9ROSA|nr:TMV resistance protein N-like [Pyrus ussuriensis x Pyrus communis]
MDIAASASAGGGGGGGGGPGGAADVHPSRQKYDVFISFRGEDTRNTFTSHLHDALLQKKIETYIDYRLVRGSEIAPALLEAIEKSTLSLVIFSKNYASSTWCLDELAHILNCRETVDQMVIPIFYDISPSDIRKQQGTYADAFAQLEIRFKDGIDKVHKWRAALTTVANLSGFDYSNKTGTEADLVKKVVNEIWGKLNQKSSSNLKGLVGMERRIDQVESTLCIDSLDVYTVGIWGMGGIGKTTLADAVFHRLSSKFEASCFLKNVREKSERTGGLDRLRNTLVSEILKEKDLNIGTLTIGSYLVRKRMGGTKVLIVLDDVNDSNQLNFLAGDPALFGPGSRIIITTRDKSLLQKSVDHDKICKVQELNSDEALQLFRLCAFGNNISRVDCTELSKIVVDYCGGIPLALQILGSSFLHCESKEDWLDEWKEFPREKIWKVFRSSYDGLKEIEKEVFLDIACFYQGKDEYIVKEMLDICGFREAVIKVLIDKSLISISTNNCLEMHNLLQEMGRAIVHEQCIEEPIKCNRLFFDEDVNRDLKTNTGSATVQAIFLNRSEIIDFEKMYDLRLLYIYNSSCNKYCKVKVSLPHSLTYLGWEGYPFKSLPSKLCPENLVELQMRNSKVEQLWNEGQNLKNLKVMDLHLSVHLIKVPDLSQSPNIEHIDLYGCKSLVEIPSYFPCLDKLSYLNLTDCAKLKYLSEMPSSIEYLYLDSTAIEELPSSVWSLEKIRCLELPKNIPILDLSGNATNCKNLVSLLESICKLKSLKSLDLSGTTIRSLPAIIGNLESLEKLDLSGTAIRSLPASIGNLESLEKLDLSGTAKLDLSGTAIKSLPASIGNLKSLVKLDLSGTAIEGLPASIGNLKSLKKLDLSETAIESLPASIGNLESLENLDLSGTAIKSLHASIGKLEYLQKFYLSGTAIESLPASIGNLKSVDKLDLSETAIKSLPASIGNLKSLEKLDLSGTAIESLPASIGSLKSLENLDLSGTTIESLPASFDNLKSLVKLDLSGTAFKSLPAIIGNLKSLEKLDLSGTAIESLPASIGNLKSLEKLDLSGTAVESLPASIGNLESLEKLDLSGTAIKSLPTSIGNLESLEKLDLRGTTIESLPASIGNLESLKKLDLSGTAIQSLPASIGNLKSLEKLDLSGTAIKSLPACIGNLKSLEKLDLSGTAIKCLPASTKEASRLISLGLTNCRSLESLPDLPGVRWLEAHGCISLNKVLSSKTALSLGWDEYKHSQGLQEQLTFSNCIGVGGDAWLDILTDSQIRIMRMATALSKYFTQEEIEVAFHLEFEEEINEYVFRSPVCIVCPGSTIPRWFPNEVDNSALAINLGSNFFNTSFLGFAYSVVVAFENYNVGGSLRLGCKINFKGCGDPFIYHRSCMVAEYGEINDCKFDTPHVFVWFSTFDHVKRGSYNGVTEAIFEFYPMMEDRPDDEAVDCSNIKVAKCGIFPMYAPNDSALK